MKAHHRQHSSPLQLLLPPPNKPRRCTALAAGVPALVVCSILLPLVFLLGLHRPGPGYGLSEERAAVVITTELPSFGARSNKQHLENGGAMKHKLLKSPSRNAKRKPPRAWRSGRAALAGFGAAREDAVQVMRSRRREMDG